MIFIDTNFFLRFFLKDIKGQYLEAKKIFKEGARGEKELVTSIVVIFEVFWVLNSYYRYSRSQISKTIKDLLKMKFIQLQERLILEESVALYDLTNLSLGDCYNLTFAKSQGIRIFNTFDQKLAKIFKKSV